MDIMRDIPDKYFELAIVDPPYGIGVASMNIGARTILNRSCDRKDWDKYSPDPSYFDELRRVSCEQIIWGANYFNCFGGNFGAIVWDKDNPLPTASRCEIASYSKHARVAYYKQTWTNYVNSKSTNHPTEKPVALYRWLLQNYAKTGDKIIDTHSGSGSCAIACHIEKHDFLAIEKDPDYHAASVKRLEEVRAQGVLF